MASSTSRLFEVTPPLSLEQQAVVARSLITANELYTISNSIEYSSDERSEALRQSSTLTKEALEKMPGNSVALNLMARIKLDHAEHDQAERLLINALKTSPADENTRLNYAYLLLAKRQYHAAEDSFQSILKANRKSIRAFSGIALAKLRQKDYLGAFNHYRKLLEMGVDSASIRTYFLESAEFLSSDYYQPELEALLVTAFSWQGTDHQKLSNLVTSLLTAKYDLNNEHAMIDIQQLTQDQLLLEALSKTLLSSVSVESLVTALRSSILEEVMLTQSLSDALLPFATALGIYAARTDYALMLTQKEDEQLSVLIDALKQACQSSWSIEDISGALIVVSMYEAIYSQSFSFQLLRHNLDEWPFGMQDLMNATLYELCNEHQSYIDLFGQTSDSLLSNEIRRASGRWNSVNALSKSNWYDALRNELDSNAVPERFKTEKLNVLLVGCGAGLRAIYLSHFFENTAVYALDQSRENIAYAQLMAQKLGIYDIHFTHSSYDTALIGEEQFDIIEFGEDLNHTQSPETVITEWLSLLSDDGLVRFTFNTLSVQETTGVITQLVQDRRLSPTADNIRHLRHAIIQEASSGLWDPLFSDEQFYTSSGCKALFFNRYNHYFDLKTLDPLIKNADLTFAGFVDIPQDIRNKANPVAPYSLLSWHAADQDNTIFGNCYNFYCHKSGQV